MHRKLCILDPILWVPGIIGTFENNSFLPSPILFTLPNHLSLIKQAVVFLSLITMNSRCFSTMEPLNTSVAHMCNQRNIKRVCCLRLNITCENPHKGSNLFVMIMHALIHLSHKSSPFPAVNSFPYCVSRISRL